MQPTCDLYKTVAHIDLSYRDDLQLVYVDNENDLAYYMYLTDKRNLSIGDKVYLNTGIECTVSYIDAYGFAFTSDAYAYQGLSGTAVRDVKGNQLGYISRTLNEDEIYCIWS